MLVDVLVVVAAVLEVVAGVVAGVLAVVAELVVLEELPQPASASRPMASATAESVGRECFFARACAGKLTSQILHR